MDCLDSGQSAMERQHSLRGLFPGNDRHKGLQSADAGRIDTTRSEEEPQKSVGNGGGLPNGELERMKGLRNLSACFSVSIMETNRENGKAMNL